ncbi:MAG: 16S rRNA (cytidine(1402)-2'-O)-methyltransferase [Clostridia bacterium]|nr:16S rRNA (cytidine(1402)-2'-O)-methyltransferase [Clostridia bacterium]MCL6521340.1 16S rRNA (cytidine(1402)-2'-O)-methyltransferase [Bacillota bacterium]
MAGTLYVVATPIGNLEDVTLRALAVLRAVDRILCEDTRHTALLLRRYAIQKPLVSYHEHNERRRAEEAVAWLEAGEELALVSDAGTPTLSDPGYRLVSLAAERGLRVVPVPGPMAAVAALSASGLPTDSFTFAGFPPRRAGPRQRWLRQLAGEPRTVVLYEAPERVARTLAEMRDLFGGERRAVVARELTKSFEEFRRGSLDELASALSGERARGEYVLLVEGAGRRQAAGEGTE